LRIHPLKKPICSKEDDQLLFPFGDVTTPSSWNEGELLVNSITNLLTEVEASMEERASEQQMNTPPGLLLEPYEDTTLEVTDDLKRSNSPEEVSLAKKSKIEPQESSEIGQMLSFDDLFTSKESDEQLFGANNTSDKFNRNDSLFSSKTRDGLFSSSSKDKRDRQFLKNEALFGDLDDEETNDLFASAVVKRIKSVPSPKTSSLFGEEDETDIFGSTSLNEEPTKKPTSGASRKSRQPKKGDSEQASKPGSSGSLKPVKLEAKQAFKDPLLHHEEDSQ